MARSVSCPPPFQCHNLYGCVWVACRASGCAILRGEGVEVWRISWAVVTGDMSSRLEEWPI